MKKKEAIMAETERAYILGAGAIGLALAVHLVNNGKKATVVRIRNNEISEKVIEVSMQHSINSVIKVPVEMISLSKLKDLRGIIVITAKSYANTLISAQIREKGIKAPIIIMQNGIGVEDPYIFSGFSEIYRCILYTTSQKTDEYNLRFRSINTSPIGLIMGSEHNLKKYVEQLSTPAFEFCVENNIQDEIWKKAIINSVFNSICPLLDVDNGIFIRNKKVADLANEIINECIKVAQCLGLNLTQKKIMEQLLKISKGSEGQFISTLQDIRNGNETEIEFLNLEITRVAEKMTPKIKVDKTKLLGTMILMKSLLHRQLQVGTN
ncbi:hypothetical protein JYT44_02030 [Caldithrix abyssi]|nr:hypothetical protein [Caldithrix abyssi]